MTNFQIYPAIDLKDGNCVRLVHGQENSLDVKIFDLKGQIVMRKKISLENNLINISSLKQGIYIIKAEGNDSLFQQKLMVH